MHQIPSSSTDAAPQAAGYIFQLRYALLQALKLIKKDPTSLIGVERLDDVSHVSSGQVHTAAPPSVDAVLHQLKHTTNPEESFSDFAKPVWRTLGNWSRLIKLGAISLDRTQFLFVTNVPLEPGSALSKLGIDDGGRDVSDALAALRSVAATSANSATSKDRAAFVELSSAQQEAFLARVKVVAATGLADLTAEIEDELYYVCEAQLVSDCCAELEGWWLQKISAAFANGSGLTMQLTELSARISILREKYKLSSLYIDDDGTPQDISGLDEYMFVKQAEAVGVGTARVRHAQTNFLRARTQRSRWLREAKIDPSEIDRYDRELRDLWTTQFLIMSSEVSPQTPEDTKSEKGRALLNWAETHVAPLRDAQAQFLTSGSFHGLADEVSIGWHPDYEAKFSK